MRELKYRSYDSENSCFTFFALSDIDRKGGVKTKYGWSSLESLIETGIEEFIGLQDKNGRDIYVGDIVGAVTSGDFGWKATGKVEFVNSSYAVNCGPCYPDSDKDCYFWFDLNTHKDIEVIGNIYEPINAE